MRCKPNRACCHPQQQLLQPDHALVAPGRPPAPTPAASQLPIQQSPSVPRPLPPNPFFTLSTHPNLFLLSVPHLAPATHNSPTPIPAISFHHQSD